MERIYSLAGHTRYGFDSFKHCVKIIADNVGITILDESSNVLAVDIASENGTSQIDNMYEASKLIGEQETAAERESRLEQEKLALKREKAEQSYANVRKLEYVVLESRIPYDWDDYDLWADTLYNMNDGQIDTDRYGHGSPSVAGAENSLSYEDAIALGLVEESKVKEVLYTSLFGKLAVSEDMFLGETDLYIPCRVTGGRKFRGRGVLLSYYRKKSPYGYDSWQDVVKVLDPASNEIKTVNSFSYIEFDDDVRDKILARAEEQRREYVMNMPIKRLAHLNAYRISYSACDSRTFNEYRRDVSYVDLKGLFQQVDTSGSRDLEHEKQMEKQESFRTKKIAELKDWARSKGITDGSDDELQAFAEKLFSRRYS